MQILVLGSFHLKHFCSNNVIFAIYMYVIFGIGNKKDFFFLNNKNNKTSKFKVATFALNNFQKFFEFDFPLRFSVVFLIG